MKMAVYYKKKREIAFFLNWNTEIQRHGEY